MKNIYLIGMMGCGKSTCGKLLSRRLGRPMVDTDRMIEQEQGCTISEIFAARGEEAFRDLETELVRKLAQQSGLIVATGGGLPLREENAALLRESGLVIWLKRDPDSTFSSVSMAGRPLARKGPADFAARFQQRAPLYQRAAHVVIEDFSGVKVTVDAIVRALRETRGGL